MNMPITMHPMKGDKGFARTHSKTNGPSTSKRAAERAQSFAGGQSALILEKIRYICSCDNKIVDNLAGAGADLISAHTQLTKEAVCRRLPDLQRAGLIEVVQYQGADLVRNGYRCWRAVEGV